MKVLLIGLMYLVGSSAVYGHNPLSAKYHLEIGQNASLLSINLSQDGVNLALIKQYTEERVNALSQNEFKELIVQHVKDNFKLSINNQDMDLGKGGIKLGSHQTDLKFVLPPFLNPVTEYSVSISSFKENENHQTIFSHNLEGKNKHVILDLSNEYTSSWSISDADESHMGVPIFLTAIFCFFAILWKVKLHKN